MDFALFYAAQGLPVFPVAPKTKIPLISRENGGKGVLDATTDARIIRDWWASCPRANIGGAAGILYDLMDVDEDGEESLAEHPPIVSGPEVSCPGGGCHIYCDLSLVPLTNMAKIAPGLDIRTLGGYGLLPPSYIEVHPDPNSPSPRKRRGYKGHYAWKRPFDVFGMPPFPAWAANLAQRAKEGQMQNAEIPMVIEEGSRNIMLYRRGCNYRRFSHTEAEIFEMLQILNRLRCKPMLEEHEIREIARSASTHSPERDPGKFPVPEPKKASDEPRSGPIGSFITNTKPTGVPTGFDFIDQNTTCHGLADGQMHVVSASTGGGKTAFKCQVAYNAAKLGYAVCYITVADMVGEDLFDRIVKNISGWYGGDEPLDQHMAEEWHRARIEVESLPIHIHDVSEVKTGRDVYQISEWVRGQGDRFALYIVDYAQELCAGSVKSEYERAELASHELRWLARQTKRPILVGSQITEGNSKQGTTDITKGSRTWEERAGSLLVLKVLDDDQRGAIPDLEYRAVQGLTSAHLRKNRFGKKNLKAFWKWQDSKANFIEL